jgi:antirestriction protein ArdC
MLLLSITSELDGYASPYRLTFNQARELGGSVRKGEHGTTVVFLKSYHVCDDAAEDPDATKTVRVMRGYTVFNVEQCDGLQLPPRFTLPEREPADILPTLQSIMNGYAGGPAIVHKGGDRAYYSPATDTITLPDRGAFASPNGYAETVLHELIHSAGHAMPVGTLGVHVPRRVTGRRTPELRRHEITETLEFVGRVDVLLDVADDALAALLPPLMGLDIIYVSREACGG